jgi:hypothetical protein
MAKISPVLARGPRRPLQSERHLSPIHDALEVAAVMGSSMARPHTRSSPVPLSFSPEEMDLLLSLAAPIDPALRPAFLGAVATAIGEQASGPGLVHQVGKRIQREFWTPPQLSPNATAPVHRGHAA